MPEIFRGDHTTILLQQKSNFRQDLFPEPQVLVWWYGRSLSKVNCSPTTTRNVHIDAFFRSSNELESQMNLGISNGISSEAKQQKFF